MISVNRSRTVAIARKEVRHVLRDPFTLALALGLPVVLLVFFGFAIDYDIQGVRLGVADNDGTLASRRLIEVFRGSDYFLPRLLPRTINPLSQLDIEADKAVLIIEPRFGRDLATGKPVEAQLVLDGADNLVSGIVSQYLAGIQSTFNSRLPDAPPNKVAVEARFLFNPELNSHWFFVPGLIVVINGLISTLLTSLTVAREWEKGSMEMLLSTPVQPAEIILGKLTPYAVLGIASALLVFLAARLVFGVPMNGSYALLIVSTLIFLSATLAQGLLISVMARQQQLAMQIAVITGLLPAFLLSGFIFPIANMTRFFHYFTAILPARWFMQILRPVFLRGSGFWDMRFNLFVLSLLSTILIGISILRFKKDLEP